MTVCGNRRRAFTLTEIAIVLGVVGLIFSGIWVAYSAVSERRKVNEAIDDIRFIMNRVQSLAAVNPNAFKFTAGNTIGCNLTFNEECNDPVTGAKTTCPTPKFNASQSDLPITPYAAQAGLFPQSMLANGALNNNPLSPWSSDPNSSVQFTLVTNTDACSATPSHPAQTYGQPANTNINVLSWFDVRITFQDSVPASGCIQLLTSDAAELVAEGLVNIATGSKANNGGFSNGYWGLTPQNYKTMMSAANIQAWCTAASPLQLNLDFTYPPANQ